MKRFQCMYDRSTSILLLILDLKYKIPIYIIKRKEKMISSIQEYNNQSIAVFPTSCVTIFTLRQKKTLMFQGDTYFPARIFEQLKGREMGRIR